MIHLYAYSGVPVVITDAMVNWTATEVFSFEYFKNIYPNESPALDNYDRNCQFFPYKTQFKRLREIIRSNCDPLVANALRQHYQRPYFMPQDSEGTKMDWIFMGSPKYGAHMHVDHVGHPSWQAQVRGTKKWILEPPTECYTTCKVLELYWTPTYGIIKLILWVNTSTGSITFNRIKKFMFK
ncbi:unnamed protein product [Oppiella nova]|uniref:JmjC domain-containing protein n=1 Tax=Oppiella nova TaxID=334625 RepID=A0A7R9LJ98_9ACAR|nr:unnamed protein product [Oppiella nova]CAG2164130.1 unnamed protein product [Oppiella nova]